MAPDYLNSFIIESLSAAASFIGLLFVGLSVVLQKIGDDKIADNDRQLAENSYSGLVNIFFVCLLASIRHESIGIVCLVMALFGLFSCWRLRNFTLLPALVVSVIIYCMETVFAISILIHPNKDFNSGWFETIIVGLFAISLIKAWRLVSVRQRKGNGKND